MTEKEFIAQYGEEAQEVTKNYTTKSLGKNYHVKDSFIEFGDNSYDAKIEGKPINFLIDIDDDSKTFTIMDDGSGIKNEKTLFKLGGTDKDGQQKIGKYGIGVPGAVSGLATKCRFNKNVDVEVIYESSCDGIKFEKHILFTPKGEQFIGQAKFMPCEANDHGTKITFRNVQLKQISEVIEALEITFEESMKKGLNIVVNGRQLGRTLPPTFTGEETEEKISVGNFNVYLKYRASGSNSSDEREFEKSGIRFYDRKTGRLLGINTGYWSWFADKKAQQNICGVRVGIYIESSIECYDKFGVKPQKNGIEYSKYFKDPDFKELSLRLKEIYKWAAKSSPNKVEEDTISIGPRTFSPMVGKMEKLFIEIGNNNFIYKKKMKPKEIVSLINDYITLQNDYMSLKKKLQKNSAKSYAK